jgi:NAD(P)-dependent dehydrogenase (short-subunit alcohol dehydrogenase family)
MDLQLSGKTAVITGGSKGIGKACARLLAEEGVDVAILARNQRTLDATAAEIAAATSRRVLAIACDTGDTASVNAAFERAAKELGRLDILVNCAAQPGGAPPRPGIEHLPDENFVEQMNVKVLGYARCARAAVPHMKANGWGRIINISGLAARQTGNAIGSMRNVAVSALTKNLADELGPFGKRDLRAPGPDLDGIHGAADAAPGRAARRDAGAGEGANGPGQHRPAHHPGRRHRQRGGIPRLAAFDSDNGRLDRGGRRRRTGHPLLGGVSRRPALTPRPPLPTPAVAGEGEFRSRVCADD